MKKKIALGLVGSFCLASSFLTLPAKAGENVEIRIHADQYGTSVQEKYPDGYRTREKTHVHPYTGQTETWRSEGYGRNPQLRDGTAPEILESRIDSYGHPQCPQGYGLMQDMFGRPPRCIRYDVLKERYFPR